MAVDMLHAHETASATAADASSLRSRVPLYEHNPIPGVTQPVTIQWLNPNAFQRSIRVRAHTRKATLQAIASSEVFGARRLVARTLSGAWFALTERVKLRLDAQFFTLFNHPSLALQ
jgi:hypothetical protein